VAKGSHRGGHLRSHAFISVSAESKELGTIDIEIPKYPYPYTRGPNGGVYVKSVLDSGDGEETDKTLVYENEGKKGAVLSAPSSGAVVSQPIQPKCLQGH